MNRNYGYNNKNRSNNYSDHYNGGSHNRSNSYHRRDYSDSRSRSKSRSRSRSRSRDNHRSGSRDGNTRSGYDNKNHNYKQSHYRNKSRSNSRSRSSGSKNSYQMNNYTDSFQQNNQDDLLEQRIGKRRVFENNHPSTTICIKGFSEDVSDGAVELALESFSPRSTTGESRSLCFVDFNTLEESAKLLEAYPASSGKEDGEELIIGDPRYIIQMDYAEPESKKNKKLMRSDWICSSCETINYGKMKCAKCLTPKNENAKETTVSCLEPTNLPSKRAIIQGIGLRTTEKQIKDTLREFAPVEKVQFIKDHITGNLKGYCVVSFPSVEYCNHVINNAYAIVFGDYFVKIGYAGSIPETMIYRNENRNNIIAEQAEMMAQWSSHFTPKASSTSTSNTEESQQQQNQYTDITKTAQHEIITKKMSGEKIWPDVFQTNGGTYILDTQSGYYYHSLSMFYYEPTIDTYLDSMTGYYYRYDTSVNQFVLFVPPIPTSAIISPPQPPPTQPVQQQQQHQQIPSMIQTLPQTIKTQTTTPQLPQQIQQSPQSKPIPSMIPSINIELAKKHPPPPLPSSTSSTTSLDNNNSLKKLPSMIPISLPENIFSKKSSGNNNNSIQLSSTTTTTTTVNNNPKSPSLQPIKHVKTISPNAVTHSSIALKKDKLTENIAKWSQKQSEIDKANFANTREPICTICKRKFKNLLLLSRHESESALHKKNLELLKEKEGKDNKEKEEKKGEEEEEEVVYRDRAKERREKFGSEPILRAKILPVYAAQPQYIIPTTVTGIITTTTGAADTNTPIEEDNIGAKMLEKMGWEKGRGIGGTFEGIKEPIKIDKPNNLANSTKGANVANNDYSHEANYKRMQALYKNTFDS